MRGEEGVAGEERRVELWRLREGRKRREMKSGERWEGGEEGAEEMRDHWEEGEGCVGEEGGKGCVEEEERSELGRRRGRVKWEEGCELRRRDLDRR